MEFPIPTIIIPKDEPVSEPESEANLQSDPEPEPTSDPLELSLSELLRRPREGRREQNSRGRRCLAIGNPEEPERKCIERQRYNANSKLKRSNTTNVELKNKLQRTCKLGLQNPLQIPGESEERKLRRKADQSRQGKERYNRKMEQETPEERAERLEKLRERYRRRLAKEVSEEGLREIKAEKSRRERERYKLKMEQETPAERAKRLGKCKQKYRRRMANEALGVLDRAQRLEKLREQYRRRMGKDAPGVQECQLNGEASTTDHEWSIWPIVSAENQNKSQEKEERLKVERDVRLLRMKCETEEQRLERRRRVVEIHRKRHRRTYGTEKPLGWIGLKDPVPECPKENGKPSPRLECPVCKTLVKEDQMDHHLLTHPDAASASFKCAMCPHTCPTVAELKLHRARHYNISALEDHDFYCEICSTIIYNRARYVTHLRHHIRKTGLKLSENEPIYFYICDFDNCQICFRDKPRFISHLESHSAERVTFQCAVCQKPFSNESNCNAHVQLAHTAEMNNTMDCPYCHQVILNKEEDWEYHLWTHQIRLDDEPQGHHLCENCGKTCRTAQLLKRHVQTHEREHQLDATPRRARKEHHKKPHQNLPCTVCNKSLSGKIALSNHMLKYHTYEHGVVCYICDKSYKYLWYLTSHIRKHNNEPNITRRAKCEFCDKDFSCYLVKDKHRFYEHREEYLKNRPYCCTNCYRNFGCLERLKMHLPMHDKYRCPMCGLCSISKFTHELHLRSHDIGPLAGTRKQKYSDKYARDNGKKSNSEFYEAQRQEREMLGDLPDNYFFQNGVGYIKISDIMKERSNNVAQDEAARTPAPDDISNIGDLNVLDSSALAISSPESLLQTESNEADPIPVPILPIIQEKKYMCDRCPYQFQFPRPLLTHISWHISEETMNVEPVNAVLYSALPVGGVSTELDKYLNPNYIPIEEPTSSEPHVCPECAASFLYFSNLSNHRRVKHGIFSTPACEKQYKCNYCVRHFTNQYKLTRHTEEEHQQHEGESLSWDSAMPVEPVTSKSKSKPKPLSKKIKPGPRKREITKQSVNKDSHFEVLPVVRTNLLGDRARFQCDQCNYTSTRETALQRHKQVTHENPEEPKEDEEESEWILPVIKNEPLDTDDMDWEPSAYEYENDMFSDPIYSAEVFYQDDPALVIKYEELPTITELQARVAESRSSLSPHLQAMAESLPLSYVQLNRVELPFRESSSVQNRARTTSLKESAMPRRSHKRKRDRRNPALTSDRKSKKSRSSESASDVGAEHHDSKQNETNNSSLNSLKCNQEGCVKTFGKKFFLRRHLRTKHGIYERKPIVRPKRISEKQTKNQTNDSSLNSFEFECNQEGCTKSFRKKPFLRRHLRTVHGIYERKPTVRPKLVPENQIETSSTSKTPFEQSDYYCDICYRSIKYKSKYDRHLRTHIDVDPTLNGVITMYQCDECPSAYRLKDMFLRHLETHGANGLNLAAVCSVCSKTFAKLDTLELHRKNVHETEDLVYDCQFCHHSFSTQELLESHGQIHRIDLSAEYDGNEMCAHCGKRFRSLGALNGHIERAHDGEGMDPRVKPLKRLRKCEGGKVSNNNRVPCQICNQSIRDKLLKNHMLKEHTYQHGVYCFVCGETFSWLGALNTHILEFHDDGSCNAANDPTITIASSTELDKKSQIAKVCLWCKAKFKGGRGERELHKHQFDKHRELYLQDKPFYCKICYQNFATEDELNIGHTHNITYVRRARRTDYVQLKSKHKCPQCDERFTRKDYLKVHMLKHGGERQHQCSMCDKKFTTIFNLRDHEKRHLKTFTSYCPHCPEKTVGYYKKVHLDQHVAKVHASLLHVEAEDIVGSSYNNSEQSGPNQVDEVPLPVQIDIRRHAKQQVVSVAGPNLGFLIQQPPVPLIQHQNFVLNEHGTTVQQENLSNYSVQFDIPLETVLQYQNFN